MDKRLSRASVVCLLVLVVGASFVGAQTPPGQPDVVSGTSVWDPFMFFHVSPIGTADFQEYVFSCPGGTPTIPNYLDRFWHPCTRGVVEFGFKLSMPFLSSDPRGNGELTIYVAQHHDALGNGISWGTWKLKTDGGGDDDGWEGTFSSTRALLPETGPFPAACHENLPGGWPVWPCWAATGRYVGQGTGALQGSRIQLTNVVYSRYLHGLESIAVTKGWIVPSAR